MHLFALFQFKALFKELSHHVEDILAIHHLGVISKVAETCQRLACCQDKFVKVNMYFIGKNSSEFHVKS